MRATKDINTITTETKFPIIYTIYNKQGANMKLYQTKSNTFAVLMKKTKIRVEFWKKISMKRVENNTKLMPS